LNKSSGTLFGLVVGFVAGALVAALVMPARHRTLTATGPVVAGAAGSSSGSPSGSSSPSSGSSPLAGGGTGSPSAAAPGGTGGGGSQASASAGSSSAGGSSSGGGSSPSPTAAGGTPAGGNVRGLSATAITIGIAYPDISALRALGKEYDNGDVPKQWMAILDQWKRQGLVPVNGRDVVLKFEKYQVTDLQDQNRACAALIDDDRSFAVVGVEYFEVGADCVARQYRTPLVTADGPLDSVFARGAPFLISIGTSEGRLLRNLVHWADARGMLKGRKVGIYYFNNNIGHERVQVLSGELAKVGQRVKVAISTDQLLGGPQDAVAVQKFRALGVDLAILETSKAGFLQAAQAQGYRPTFIESDADFGTSDTATSTYPADEFDGTFAMTGRKVGDAAAGTPITAAQEACVANYERYSGQKVLRPGRAGHLAAVYAYILADCDEATVLMTGLRQGGANLTPASFIAGIETMRSVDLLRYPAVTYTPTKHAGVDSQRTLQWHKSCTCWVAMSPWAPLFVP
jgi:hypothetical protein